MEFTLLEAALTALGGLYGALWWMGRRDATMCVRDLWDIAVAAGIAGLACGRLVAMLRSGTNPLTNPGEVILVRAGVDTAAAAAGALIAAAWLARADLTRQLDALAPAVLFGLAGWHSGCLFRGACLGTPSSLPWAWSLPGSSITRHPVEIYAGLLLAAAGWVLFRLRMRYPAPALVAALALVAAAGIRLATEPFRPGLLPGPLWWYGAAVGGGLVLAGWAVRQDRPHESGPPLQ